MRFPSPRARGFSIVELLVSVAIGLLALVFATRLITSSESAKGSALGTSDSMQNGMLAMFSISGDAQQAGFGLNDRLLLGCDTIFTDARGYALQVTTPVPAGSPAGTLPVRRLAPVIIQAGAVTSRTVGAGSINVAASDTISFYSGSADGGTGTLRLVGNYLGGTTLNVDRRPYGFARGDVVVVAPEDRVGNCALAQVSAAPDNTAVLAVAGGASTDFRYNTGQLGRNFDGGRARVFNLGPATSLSFHTWSVADGFLKLRSTDMAERGDTDITVADNIVAIKAQYGFDTRTGAAYTPAQGMVVGSWSSTMINADGDSTVGGVGDYERISALRIAVVARSKTRSAPVGGTCTATAADEPKVFRDAEAVATTAANATTVDVADPDWRCYRYRVFETVIPLRNTNWRP